jgi:hypothetical protein
MAAEASRARWRQRHLEHAMAAEASRARRLLPVKQASPRTARRIHLTWERCLAAGACQASLFGYGPVCIKRERRRPSQALLPRSGWFDLEVEHLVTGEGGRLCNPAPYLHLAEREHSTLQALGRQIHVDIAALHRRVTGHFKSASRREVRAVAHARLVVRQPISLLIPDEDRVSLTSVRKDVPADQRERMDDDGLPKVYPPPRRIPAFARLRSSCVCARCGIPIAAEAGIVDGARCNTTVPCAALACRAALVPRFAAGASVVDAASPTLGAIGSEGLQQASLRARRIPALGNREEVAAASPVEAVDAYAYVSAI